MQLPLVLKCKQMGIETHCFSWEDGAVCKEYADYFYPISIIEKELILEKCRKIGIDAVTTIASDVAVVTVNHIASGLGLVANKNEYTDMTTNKYSMRKALASKNVPCPQFIRIRGGEIPNLSGMRLPLIVKPVDRSGSRGVTEISSMDELANAIENAHEESFNNECIIEEFVDGREISVESISYRGKHYILQMTDKVTTGAPHFVELEHHQPSTLPDDTKGKVRRIVLDALDALHIEYGASHSELKITEDGSIYVIEIGARMGGDFIGSHLVQLSTGYDFLKGVVQASLGEFEPPVIKESNFSGVYFISKETEHLRKYVEKREMYPEIVQAEMTDQTLRTIRESADRSGYFIYKSDHRFNCN